MSLRFSSEKAFPFKGRDNFGLVICEQKSVSISVSFESPMN